MIVLNFRVIVEMLSPHSLMPFGVPRRPHPECPPWSSPVWHLPSPIALSLGLCSALYFLSVPQARHVPACLKTFACAPTSVWRALSIPLLRPDNFHSCFVLRSQAAAQGHLC